MISTVELGRKMMAYAKNLNSDVEFNNWCRLAPKLISLGAPSYPKSIKELSEDERALMDRALAILVQDGRIVLKN